MGVGGNLNALGRSTTCLFDGLIEPSTEDMASKTRVSQIVPQPALFGPFQSRMAGTLRNQRAGELS